MYRETSKDAKTWFVMPETVVPFHIVPDNDVKSHRLTIECECMPRMEEVLGSPYPLIIHNAFDLREVKEFLDKVGRV